MKSEPQQERTVVVYTAESQSEAMVLRGLLEASGVPLPGVTPDPFPLNEAGWSHGARHGIEISVYESQETEARRIIDDYLNRSEPATGDK